MGQQKNCVSLLVFSFYLLVEMNNIESFLCRHASVRQYLDKPVDDDILDRIIECGGRASNTGNMQVYSVVVTRDAELRRQLCEQHFGQGSTAPLMLTICADVHRYHLWCRQRGCDEPYGNFLWFLSGVIDASLFAQNLCVAAESEGLGFCHLGTVLYNTRAIADILELPKGVVPVIALSLGWPAQQPALSERLPVEGIAHSEKYHAYTPDDIDRIHRLREEFPFNQEMVRQNGTRNLAEIFTRIRYPRESNESISRALKDFLTQAGME